MIETKLKWHPIAASDDLAPRHVFDAQLLGQEIAAWRADDGFANVWENRCLHRGVRLTIGINDGNELKCQYHGWRYSNRSANCTYIPAHPADAPARTVCNRKYTTREKYGLVWTAIETSGDVPEISLLAGVPSAPLRAMPINSTADLVEEMLSAAVFESAEDNRWSEMSVETDPSGAITFTGSSDKHLVFFLQPLDSERTIIRGVATGIGDDDIAGLRHLNQCLTTLRAAIEARAAQQDRVDPMQPVYTQVEADLATMPDRGEGSVNGIRVRVASKTMTANDVARFEFVGLTGSLPTGQAGAHIDVHLPNGLIRQYSLTNGPAETDSYIIGVKREPNSTGGSECLHDTVREGDILLVSVPRNNFPLRRDAVRSVFVAGGIGITPLLSMAKTLENQRLNYELHYFVRDDDHVAFADKINALTGKITLHKGLSPEDTGKALHRIYNGPQNANHTYICGPGPMLNAAREAASHCGWDDGAVHFEYFKNTNEIDDSSSFEIALARSGQTLQVKSGETVLDVLRANGVSIASSCSQGACGTCKVAVIEGDVDHQDVHLTDSEKRASAYIMTCVSRAKSDRLVLDI